ncbi:hypothetical protein ig2599ANME_0454 [groundwater metagenome]
MNIGKEITNGIQDNRNKIDLFLKVSQEKWRSRINHINGLKELKNIPEDDLTFIFACAYAIEGQERILSLQQIISDQQIHPSEKDVNLIWFKHSPYAVNKEEGRGRPSFSELDLAFGNIKPCIGTESYISYGPKDTSNGWICFVEMKILTDIDVKSTDNPNYNQLAKYIKNALTIQKYGRTVEGKYPSEVHVSLITPKRFIDNKFSRLYGYKFEEYTSVNEINFIKRDIPNRINHENFNEDWLDPMQQPDIDKRLKNLKLHWIPYENLLDNIPDSNLLKTHIDEIHAANPIFDKPSESK